MPTESAKNLRRRFVQMAILFEGGLLVVALAGGYFLNEPPWMRITFSIGQIGVGCLATFPLIGMLTLIYRSRIRQLVELRELTSQLIGESLSACSWIELLAIAMLAGVSEECLFRGTIEPWLFGLGTVTAILVGNLLFGLCHALTPTYFLFAMVVGLYLSWTLRWTNPPNLLVPILCHGLYDFVAFAVIRKSHGKRDLQSSPNDDQATDAQVSPDSPVFPVRS